MATITITNASSTAKVYMPELYTTLAASGTITLTRPAIQLTRMPDLMQKVTAGTVTLTVTYDSNEKASGLLLPPKAISGTDFQPVASTTLLSGTVRIRKSFTAGVGGTADDITVYAVGTLPYSKLRILRCTGYISAGNGGGVTIGVFSATGGGGTQAGEIDCTSTGFCPPTATVTATQVLTNSGTVGLFLRRSDNTLAGEVVIVARPET